ncbi:DUF3592 domain-containing protein [Streptomyces sp. RKAG293]|uniref:DUF3592 domain-containing protein n=1 Tax=Streptomyces sp. RKAG293 TaxID=2893403 RepID=UPI002033D285|nr:DUF3592 domain-containing protein [Streptomyces sp. RKAG293]MCM2423031.1 DUF3592 domain-containing protein [Streptomyces sp. RKAG293]
MADGVVGVFAGFAAISGVVVSLAGLAGLRAIRLIGGVGAEARALVKRTGPAATDSAVRPLLQFTVADGRVVEISSPVPASRRRPLTDGSLVRVRYDPVDPRDVVVVGRERRGLEYALVGIGALFVLIGLGLLIA